MAVVLAALLLAPAHSAAVDSDLKHAFPFAVEASNGYSIRAFAANERADGRGEIVLFVTRGNEGAIYSAPAVFPSGTKKRFRQKCGDEPETVTFEPQRYRGNFEFHGEGKYTDAVTAAPRETFRFFNSMLCLAVGFEETSEATLPGARLGLFKRRGDFRLELLAHKNRPGKRSRFEVTAHEKRGKVSILRGISLWAGTAAFQYDPLLNTTILDPPAPFSGRASFHRNAAPGNRWTGNLTVDLPGKSDLPLTGATVRATLVPSCWSGGERRHSERRMFGGIAFMLGGNMAVGVIGDDFMARLDPGDADGRSASRTFADEEHGLRRLRGHG